MFNCSSLRCSVLSILLAGGTAALPAAGPGGYRSPGAYHKIEVSNEADARRAEQAGGRLIADYGAFQLFEVPETGIRKLSSTGSGPAVRDDHNLIYLSDGILDTRSDEAAKLQRLPLRTSRTAPQARELHLVQFAGPMKPEWKQALDGTGVRIIQYMASNAYVVYGTPDQIAAVQKLAGGHPGFQWDARLLERFRIQAEARPFDAAGKPRPLPTNEFVIQLVADPDANPETLALVEKLSEEVLREASPLLEYVNVTVRMDPAHVETIASRPDVFAINLFIRPKLHDEVQGQIMAGNVTVNAGLNVPSGPGYLAWLSSLNFPTTPDSYPIVDIVDDGIDDGTTNPVHPDFHEFGLISNPSRLIYNLQCANDPKANGGAGHGNINAGIVGAYNNLSGSPHVDANGYRLGLGISPFGRIAGTKIFNNAGYYDISGCFNTDAGVVAVSYTNGAHLTTNSWGAGVNGAYDASCQAYDILTRDASAAVSGNQQMLHIFSAGNDGPSAGTLDSPGGAKNVLTVGATENVRDNGTNDGCGVNEGNNFHDMATFSSRGPVAGGRVKPDLVAPGTHIQGPASQDPEYDGTGVCGSYTAPYGYYPPGQTLYTWSSGTSHSTPAVAGATSLLWNHLGRQFGHTTPSPALLKAMLINSARYLSGSGSGGNLPSNSQGYGHVDLGRAFDGTETAIKDQTVLFTATGQSFTATGIITDPARPVRVTLAYTDAPGALGSTAPWVNNLDLEVTVEGNTYRGNVFSGGQSVTGGTADTKNNVESVFLPAGLSGPIRVTVTAANIAGDAVFGNGIPADQDFALVVYNSSLEPVPDVSPGTSSIVEENCSIGNGVLDSGESVTVELALRNLGEPGSVTTNVVATLRPTGGVSLPSGPQSYGDLSAGGSEVSRPFSFVVDAPCGGTVTATLDVTDDTSIPRVVHYTFPVGELFPVPAPATGTNSTFINLPDSSNGSPWPSSIAIAGVEGRITSVTATLHSMNHTWVSDLDIQLRAPNGQTVRLLQLPGGNSWNFANTTVTFQDGAPSIPTGNNGFNAPSGTYAPTDLLSTFKGIDPNGTWELYAKDKSPGDPGNISGGWSLTLGLEIPVCCGGPNPHVTAITPLVPSHSTATEIPFLVTFDQDVTGFSDPSDVTVTRTMTLSSSGVAFEQVTASEYKVTVTGVSGDGHLGLRVNAGAVQALSDGLPNVAGGSRAVGLGTVPVSVTRFELD